MAVVFRRENHRAISSFFIAVPFVLRVVFHRLFTVSCEERNFTDGLSRNRPENRWKRYGTTPIFADRRLEMESRSFFFFCWWWWWGGGFGFPSNDPGIRRFPFKSKVARFEVNYERFDSWSRRRFFFFFIRPTRSMSTSMFRETQMISEARFFFFFLSYRPAVGG